jgi:hypothetical protein
MSLEAAIAANTAAVERLIAVLQSQQITPAADASADNTAVKRTRKAKETPAANDSGQQPGSPDASTDKSAVALHSGVNDGKRTSMNLQPGDPEGTRYFHIPAHNTVAAVKPGEVIPSIPGIEEITGSAYADLKAKYASAMVPSEGAAASAATATTPAAATPSASTASQTTSVASPGIDGPAVMEIFKKLHARDGNDGVRKALDELSAKFGVKLGRVGDLVADSAKHAAAYAYADALLNPAAAAPADLF